MYFQPGRATLGNHPARFHHSTDANMAEAVAQKLTRYTPPASPETWDAIKQASIAGVDDPDLADQFGVTRGAIRIRRLREQWPTPAKAMARAQEKAARLRAEHDQARGVTPVTVTRPAKPVTSPVTLDVGSETVTDCNRGVTEGSETLDLVADSLLERGLQASHIASRIALRTLQSVQHLTQPVESLTDVNVAMKIARTAAGMDRPDVAVNVMTVGAWSAVAVQSDDGDAGFAQEG